jgi:cell wall-associated NlpC family hydrolase
VEGYPVKEIPAEQGKPADLLFWPGHVALYLGEGRYIHSTGRSSGVVINSLDPQHPDFREDLAGREKWGSVY